MTVYKPVRTTNIALWKDIMLKWVNLNVKDEEVIKICNTAINDFQKIVEEMRLQDSFMFVHGCHYMICVTALRKNLYNRVDSEVYNIFINECVEYVMTYAR